MSKKKEEEEDEFKKSMQDSAQIDQVSAGLRQSAPVLWNFFNLLMKEGFKREEAYGLTRAMLIYGIGDDDEEE